MKTVLSIECHIVRRKTDKDKDRDDDLTKKPELLMSIAKLIPNFTQEDILYQIYTLIGFLLKQNFNELNLET